MARVNPWPIFLGLILLKFRPSQIKKGYAMRTLFYWSLFLFTSFLFSLAEKAEITQKDAAKALDATVEVIQTALANGDKVQIIGFGSFEVRDRKERKVISPATGEEIKVPATKVPAFKPGKSLKEAVAVEKKTAAKGKKKASKKK
jgi:DNA-binding protein HU-beta